MAAIRNRWRQALATALIALSLIFAGAAVAAAAGAAEENKYGVAVIIGNKAYQGRVPDVAYAHRDADAMKAYVRDVLKFREANIIDLRDATQAQMMSVFGSEKDHRGKLWGWVRPQKSDVVVFYSGHGVPGRRDRRGYLLPSNADGSTPEINGYPVDALYKNLAKLDARSATVFIDACFSGDSAGGMLIQSASPVFIKTEQAQVPSQVSVLTAAAGDQLASWDEKQKHGLFTNFLLNALYGKADGGDWGNGDGRVTLAEIKSYLDDEMTYAARRRFRREQTATVLGQEGSVLSAFVPGSPPQRPSLGDAPPTQTAARTPNVQPAPTPAPPAAPVAPVLTKVDRTFVALKTANVRAAPDVSSDQVGRLTAGEEIYVAGKVADADWYQVERGGVSFGYVYGPLLGPKPKPMRAAATGQAASTPEPLGEEERYWQAVKDADDETLLRAFLLAFPKGKHRTEAARRYADLVGGSSVPTPTVTPQPAPAPAPAAAAPAAPAATPAAAPATRTAALPPAGANPVSLFNGRWRGGGGEPMVNLSYTLDLMVKDGVLSGTVSYEGMQNPQHDGTWRVQGRIDEKGRFSEKSRAIHESTWYHDFDGHLGEGVLIDHLRRHDFELTREDGATYRKLAALALARRTARPGIQSALRQFDGIWTGHYEDRSVDRDGYVRFVIENGVLSGQVKWTGMSDAQYDGTWPAQGRVDEKGRFDERSRAIHESSWYQDIKGRLPNLELHDHLRIYKLTLTQKPPPESAKTD